MRSIVLLAACTVLAGLASACSGSAPSATLQTGWCSQAQVAFSMRQSAGASFYSFENRSASGCGLENVPSLALRLADNRVIAIKVIAIAGPPSIHPYRARRLWLAPHAIGYLYISPSSPPTPGVPSSLPDPVSSALIIRFPHDGPVITVTGAAGQLVDCATAGARHVVCRDLDVLPLTEAPTSIIAD